MKKYSVFPIIFFLLSVGCATTPTPQKTQLQIREFQTRSYETNNSKMVMKAMLNVLQDNGFIIKNAVLDLGLLSAVKEVDIENKGEAFCAIFFAGVHARYKKSSIIEATVNVSEFGNQCRCRVNFQVKTLDNKGGVIKLKQVQDAKFYQKFFSQVDKGIFIEKEKL